MANIFTRLMSRFKEETIVADTSLPEYMERTSRNNVFVEFPKGMRYIDSVAKSRGGQKLDNGKYLFKRPSDNTIYLLTTSVDNHIQKTKKDILNNFRGPNVGKLEGGRLFSIEIHKNKWLHYSVQDKSVVTANNLTDEQLDDIERGVQNDLSDRYLKSAQTSFKRDVLTELVGEEVRIKLGKLSRNEKRSLSAYGIRDGEKESYVMVSQFANRDISVSKFLNQVHRIDDLRKAQKRKEELVELAKKGIDASKDPSWVKRANDGRAFWGVPAVAVGLQKMLKGFGAEITTNVPNKDWVSVGLAPDNFAKIQPEMLDFIKDEMRYSISAGGGEEMMKRRFESFFANKGKKAAMAAIKNRGRSRTGTVNMSSQNTDSTPMNPFDISNPINLVLWSSVFQNNGAEAGIKEAGGVAKVTDNGIGFDIVNEPPSYSSSSSSSSYDSGSSSSYDSGSSSYDSGSYSSDSSSF